MTADGKHLDPENYDDLQSMSSVPDVEFLLNVMEGTRKIIAKQETQIEKRLSNCLSYDDDDLRSMTGRSKAELLEIAAETSENVMSK